MGAIVSLGGCTASFVSPDGLIVTNHHCVTGGLQFNSTPARNLLKDGYLAKTRGDELPNGPGSRVLVTTSVTDVTSEITGNIDCQGDGPRTLRSDRAADEGARRRVREGWTTLQCRFVFRRIEVLRDRADGDQGCAAGLRAGRGNRRLRRRDRQLALAAAHGRLECSRAYVGKDGKPAVFSKDNVPFKPKHWLKVSKDGAKPGEVVFVAGYPGRTQRHQTYAQVKETTEWRMPRSIRLAQEQLAILDELSKKDKALAIRVAGRVQGLNNGLTNQKGMLEGLVKGGSLATKQAQEEVLEAWIAADPARQKKYADVLPALRALQAESEKTREQDTTMITVGMASSYLGSAEALYSLSLERTKPDIDREAGFQQRDWPRIRDSQERIQRTMDATADRALLGWAMGLVAELPADQRIGPLDQAAGLKPGMPKADAEKAIDSFLQGLYGSTKLGDRDFRLGSFEKSAADLLATKDPFIVLAAALEPLTDANREASKNRAGAYARLMPRYMEAMLAKAGGQVAPDANSTLRVTYGKVEGVDAKDGLYYKPQTTLAGIVQKQTGEGDFDAPEVQLDAIKAVRANKTSLP